MPGTHGEGPNENINFFGKGENAMKKHELALDILESHRFSRKMLAENAVDPDNRRAQIEEIENIEASLRVLRADAKKGR